MDQLRVGVETEGYYLPSTKKSVEEIFNAEEIPFGSLAKNIDFRRDIGIREVHVTEELSSQLALKAVKKVIDSSGINGEEIDLIIDFTSIPQDFIGPTWAAAGLVQNEIHARHALSMSVTTGGCASYHFALKMAWAMMSTHESMKTALLFAADRTPRLNKTYYPITVASDGGCAMVLRKGCSRAQLIAVETISVGRLHDVWYVPGIEYQKEGQPQERHLHMYCDMKRFNEGVIPVNFFMFKKILNKIAETSQIPTCKVDAFIYPTFSTWDQDYFSKATGIPSGKIYTRRLHERGHVQESDMVINYADAVSDGFINSGDIVMAISNGAGFAWSAALFKH
jgi:3-oxoacyl-[acyl-carrier-protein] synthase III